MYMELGTFSKLFKIGKIQGWIQGWKTDGVIIDASAASMLRGRLCEWGGAKRHRGSNWRGPGAQPTVGQSNRALWLLGFLPFYASGHILVVSIWVKSSIMTYFSGIGQLSLLFWSFGQKINFFENLALSVTQKASFLTSNFKISSNFKRFLSHFSAFSYGNSHQSCWCDCLMVFQKGEPEKLCNMTKT